MNAAARHTAKFIERSLFVNGFVHLDSGFSIVREDTGRRRFFQICPGCSTTVATDETSIAAYIQRYNCLDCRTKECDREYAVRQSFAGEWNPGSRRLKERRVRGSGQVLFSRRALPRG